MTCHLIYAVYNPLYNLQVSNMSGRFSRTIYVGNLPSDIREWEIEDLFHKVWLDFFFLVLLFFKSVSLVLG
jgi:RNA recognition motif-containing protein